MDYLKEISEKLQKGDAASTEKLVQEALVEGLGAKIILNDGLLAGMEIVGVKFKNDELYVPEVLICARAMNFGMHVLEPLLIEEGAKPRGKFLIGTVKGDLHDIGKNLVGMMVKGAGFEVLDIGVDVSAEKFVDEAIQNNVDIIAMSAMLTTTMVHMGDVINELKTRGVRDQFIVMVGGAPLTENFATKIGADYYTVDAASCADVAKEVNAKAS